MGGGVRTGGGEQDGRSLASAGQGGARALGPQTGISAQIPMLCDFHTVKRLPQNQTAEEPCDLMRPSPRSSGIPAG